MPEQGEETGVGPAPADTVRLWCDLVKSMGPDELESVERRTYAAWDRASLADLTAAIKTPTQPAPAMTKWFRILKTYEKPQRGFLAHGPRYAGVVSDDGLTALSHPG